MQTARASATLAHARSTSLMRARDGANEARRSWRVILQATVAAALAYAAAQAIGHETPFFAPIAAIATVAVSLAHRLRRAAELLLGNALGILFADLLIAQIGTGAWQVGLVVALALTAALMVGGGPILIMQSSSAAILIATLTPPTDAEPWNTGRFVDALIGGGIGLVVSALLMPVDPARHARQATRPVLAALATGYAAVASSLRARDDKAADLALAELRATTPVLDSFHAGLDATRESVRLAPWYWGQRTLLASYALAGFQLDHALRNLRVLARQSTLALDRGEHVPTSIADALDHLSSAASGLGPVLAGEADPGPVRADLLAAVAATVGAAEEPASTGRPGLFTAPIVAQVRLSASDLLQASGMGSAEASAAIRATGDLPLEDLPA
jgi:uncharacterized membrane protein YgaE (UPF0421/DUF939 family)